MTHIHRGIGAATGAGLLLALWTCSSDSSGSNNHSISDPEIFEEKARAGFVPLIDGINDGLARLADAFNGGIPDGVVIVPTAGGADVVMQVDFDGNGSREGSIAGSFTGDIETGALLTINDVSGDEPSLDVSASLTATETAPGVVLLDNPSGGGGTDPNGSGNAADVEVTDGAVSVDLVTGVPTGSLDLDITGEGETLGISVTFASDGFGGYTVHFSGPGINFTIP